MSSALNLRTQLACLLLIRTPPASLPRPSLPPTVCSHCFYIHRPDQTVYMYSPPAFQTFAVCVITSASIISMISCSVSCASFMMLLYPSWESDPSTGRAWAKQGHGRSRHASNRGVYNLGMARPLETDPRVRSPRSSNMWQHQTACTKQQPSKSIFGNLVVQPHTWTTMASGKVAKAIPRRGEIAVSEST